MSLAPLVGGYVNRQTIELPIDRGRPNPVFIYQGFTNDKLCKCGGIPAVTRYWANGVYCVTEPESQRRICVKLPLVAQVYYYNPSIGGDLSVLNSETLPGECPLPGALIPVERRTGTVYRECECCPFIVPADENQPCRFQQFVLSMYPDLSGGFAPPEGLNPSATIYAGIEYGYTFRDFSLIPAGCC